MADHYDDYTCEELIRLLRERDRKPKFGLVWERDEIEHEKMINDDFVALDFDAGLSCGEAPFRNLIIEGDNFDALRFLRMTHAGKVKCIYIWQRRQSAQFQQVASHRQQFTRLDRKLLAAILDA